LRSGFHKRKERWLIQTLPQDMCHPRKGEKQELDGISGFGQDRHSPELRGRKLDTCDRMRTKE
jgi:hypothetical protein